ncbi:MAG TPA: MFS transporter, partial [Roseiflexaceae bacterium]|nr:MFS transporter [Roseiflexaceae bacterium]
GAAAVFALLTLVQTRFLPKEEAPREPAQPLLHDWREAFSNRAFVLFALAMLGYFALYVQFYLGLPLGLQHSTGGEDGLGGLFTLAAVLSIGLQVPITAWSQRRWTPARAITVGLATMGLAFVPLLLTAPLLPVSPDALRGLLSGDEAAGLLVGALNLAPVVLATALLTLGSLIAQPFAMGMIPQLGGGRLLGTYYGVYYLALGLGGLVGNLLAGAAFDAARRSGLDGLPWTLLVLIGCCSAASVAALERRGTLAPVREF